MNDLLLQFKNELSDELNNILLYWKNNTLDHARGGFMGKIDHYNRADKLAPKGAVLNARILWTFSAAYRHSGATENLRIAERGYHYLKQHFYDQQHGGLFWEVDVRGNPTNTRKQIYAQGFGIYGFSEYFSATGNQESLDLAIALYKLIEEHSHDAAFGGYLEALSRDWQYLDDMRLSERDENYPKSMNTHLHILEPYTNLYRSWKNEELREKIRSLIRIFLDRIIDSGSHHFNLFFDNNWEVKSDMVSYGHDIEGTWLLTEAAQIIGDPGLLREVNNKALKMTDVIIQEGLDEDCGLFYELDTSTNQLDTDKHWWPQAEALIGFINAFQISGDRNYLDYAMKVWQFIKKRMIDHEHGEWFWRVDKAGEPIASEDKAGFWKCPYHNSRACMESMIRLDKIREGIF